jgi:hypothetical protein
MNYILSYIFNHYIYYTLSYIFNYIILHDLCVSFDLSEYNKSMMYIHCLLFISLFICILS